MAKVRSLPHAGRTVSTPRPGVNKDGDAVSNLVRFDDDGVAEVTDEQAEFLAYQFDSAEVVKESKSSSGKSG